MNRSDATIELDVAEVRREMRQRRLDWARRSMGRGVSLPGGRPAASAAGVGGRQVQSLGDSDWSVDVGLVERHRIVRGWSRLQLAAAARVDPKTLRDLLGRRRRPNLGTVQAVSVALG